MLQERENKHIAFSNNYTVSQAVNSNCTKTNVEKTEDVK